MLDSMPSDIMDRLRSFRFDDDEDDDFNLDTWRQTADTSAPAPGSLPPLQPSTQQHEENSGQEAASTEVGSATAVADAPGTQQAQVSQGSQQVSVAAQVAQQVQVRSDDDGQNDNNSVQGDSQQPAPERRREPCECHGQGLCLNINGRDGYPDGLKAFRILAEWRCGPPAYSNMSWDERFRDKYEQNWNRTKLLYGTPPYHKPFWYSSRLREVTTIEEEPAPIAEKITEKYEIKEAERFKENDIWCEMISEESSRSPTPEPTPSECDEGLPPRESNEDLRSQPSDEKAPLESDDDLYSGPHDDDLPRSETGETCSSAEPTMIPLPSSPKEAPVDCDSTDISLGDEDADQGDVGDGFGKLTDVMDGLEELPETETVHKQDPNASDADDESEDFANLSSLDPLPDIEKDLDDVQEAVQLRRAIEALDVTFHQSPPLLAIREDDEDDDRVRKFNDTPIPKPIFKPLQSDDHVVDSSIEEVSCDGSVSDEGYCSEDSIFSRSTNETLGLHFSELYSNPWVDNVDDGEAQVLNPIQPSKSTFDTATGMVPNYNQVTLPEADSADFSTLLANKAKPASLHHGLHLYDLDIIDYVPHKVLSSSDDSIRPYVLQAEESLTPAKIGSPHEKHMHTAATQALGLAAAFLPTSDNTLWKMAASFTAGAAIGAAIGVGIGLTAGYLLRMAGV